MKLNEKELKCLEVLADSYHSDWNYLCFAYIVEDTKLTLTEVRRAVRSLAKKDMVQFARGLFTEDGEVAGSGYGCTRLGFDLILSKKQAVLIDFK